MAISREEIEALVGSALTERSLLEFADLKWRPQLGSSDEGVAVHVEETEELGNSIRRRMAAALAAGTRVFVVVSQGPVGLDVESQEFLLGHPVGVLNPAARDQPELALHADLAVAVRELGILLDAPMASRVASRYLERALAVTGDERGRALESALGFLASQVPGWLVRSLNFHTENEELDVVVANNSAKSPWNGSSYILIEAKNWTSNVDRLEFDAFHMKVKERGGACRVGLFVAAAGFSTGFYTRASHFGVEGYSIVPITAHRLAESLAGGTSIEEALATRVEQVVLDRQWEE